MRVRVRQAMAAIVPLLPVMVAALVTLGQRWI